MSHSIRDTRGKLKKFELLIVFKNLLSKNRLFILVVVPILVLTQGCGVKYVTRPTKGEPDQYAVITLNAIPIGANGYISKQTVSNVASATVEVSSGSNIQLIAKAYNPKGVQKLSLDILQGDKPIGNTISVPKVAPNPTALVPDTLFIIGTDGLGGQSLVHKFGASGDMVAVVVTAENFTDNTNKMVVLYEALDTPKISAFYGKSLPLCIGDVADLSWTVENTDKVLVTDSTGTIIYETPKNARATASDHVITSPVVTNTKYTLTASSVLIGADDVQQLDISSQVLDPNSCACNSSQSKCQPQFCNDPTQPCPGPPPQ